MEQTFMEFLKEREAEIITEINRIDKLLPSASTTDQVRLERRKGNAQDALSAIQRRIADMHMEEVQRMQALQLAE